MTNKQIISEIIYSVAALVLGFMCILALMFI